MRKALAGAIAGIAMILLAAPAGAAAGAPTRAPIPRSALFQVPGPTVAPRDVVRRLPGRAGARISATAPAQRYPVHDGRGDSIAVAVTAGCRETCTDAEPQQIADFVGTLIHGFEINLLTVQLETPFQLGIDCGYGANSCYYGGANRIVLSGDETPTKDGASREYVLAHEYGHHVAEHRATPAPFPPAIAWGPERWATYEHVCQRHLAGRLFPGNEGGRYFRNPGEAWAESFARYRFPDSEVPWAWAPSLEPDAAAFRALRMDTLHPWRERTSFTLSARLPPRGRGIVARTIRTPLDGRITFGPAPRRRPGYELTLRSPHGKVLRRSRHGLGFRRRVDYTVCGQSRLRIAIRSTSHRGGRRVRFRVQRP